MHAHTLSCKTTWLPAASPPASTAARDLARLIIFLLIECRGTLQGWVIKLMQRMFVSTVYLSTAKRYIRHAAHRHARTQTHTHTQGYRDLCANKHTVNDVNAHKHSLCLSLEHMYEHEHTQAQRIWVEIKIVVGVFIAGQLSKCQTDRTRAAGEKVTV